MNILVVLGIDLEQVKILRDILIRKRMNAAYFILY